MFSIRVKSILSASKTTPDDKHSMQSPQRCPKTGRYLWREKKKVGWADVSRASCPRFEGGTPSTQRPMRLNIRYLNSMGNKLPILRWLLPVVGLFSLIWFLIRVIPKPSRATYPCQRCRLGCGVPQGQAVF